MVWRVCDYPLVLPQVLSGGGVCGVRLATRLESDFGRGPRMREPIWYHAQKNARFPRAWVHVAQAMMTDDNPVTVQRRRRHPSCIRQSRVLHASTVPPRWSPMALATWACC